MQYQLRVVTATSFPERVRLIELELVGMEMDEACLCWMRWRRTDAFCSREYQWLKERVNWVRQ